MINLVVLSSLLLSGPLQKILSGHTCFDFILRHIFHLKRIFFTENSAADQDILTLKRKIANRILITSLCTDDVTCPSEAAHNQYNSIASTGEMDKSTRLLRLYKSIIHLTIIRNMRYIANPVLALQLLRILR